MMTSAGSRSETPEEVLDYEESDVWFLKRGGGLEVDIRCQSCGWVGTWFPRDDRPPDKCPACGYTDGLTNEQRFAIMTGLPLGDSTDLGPKSIFERVMEGDIEATKRMLGNHRDLVDARGIRHATPLHYAASRGHKEIVEALLDHGAAVDVQDDDSFTPLLAASKLGHSEVVEVLLTWGAAVDVRDRDGFTALLQAAGWGHQETVEVLLKHQATVNTSNNIGFTALHLAAGWGRREIVTMLLANGADVNANDGNNFTPLHAAAANGHGDVAEVLLANGADPGVMTNSGDTPLRLAVSNGRDDVSQLLRQYEARESDGRSLNERQLMGLWEYEGIWHEQQKKVIEPKPFTKQDGTTELLYFNEKQEFIYGRVPSGTSIFYDREKSTIGLGDGIRPVAHGTWSLDGKRLVEIVRSPDEGTVVTNTFDIAGISPERLIIVEPTTDPSRPCLAAYRPRQLERLPCPFIPVEMGAIGDNAARCSSYQQSLADDQASDILQKLQFQISALLSRSQFNSAHKAAQESYQLSNHFFGDQHPNTAVCLSTLGGCLYELSEHEAALRVASLARTISYAAAGEMSEVTARVLNNLAPIARANGSYRTALISALGAVTIREALYGLDSVQTAVSFVNLGYALSPIGHVTVALASYVLAESILEAAGCSGTPQWQEAVENFRVLSAAVTEDGRFRIGELPERPASLNRSAESQSLKTFCQMLIDSEQDESRFVLAVGQPCHRESYRNLILSIHSQCAKIAGLADDTRDQSEQKGRELKTLKDAQLRVLQGVSAPLTTFRGVLKRVDRSGLGPLSMATLEHAFPMFKDAESHKRSTEMLRELGVDISNMRTLQQDREDRTRDLVVDVESFVDRQFRRYSGEKNLPSRCYSSVCVDDVGNDEQTLCRELFEYTDHRIPGFIFVSDNFDQELIGAMVASGKLKNEPLSSGIFVLLLPPSDSAGRQAFWQFYCPILEKIYGTQNGHSDDWLGITTVFIPTVVDKIELPGVVDLRQQVSQEWLYRFFRNGDGAIFNKTHSDIAEFVNMLPALVYPEFGGSGVTKAIGTWMRALGIAGLVFPSARSDAGIVFDRDGRLLSHHGWNFVDYRNTFLVPDKQAHFDLNPWYDFVGSRQAAPVLQREGKSWQIKGCEQRYQTFRAFFIELLAQRPS